MHIFHKWKAVSTSWVASGATIHRLQVGLAVGAHETIVLFACAIAGCAAHREEKYSGAWELEDFSPGPEPRKKNSCLDNCVSGEPVFVLCGRDFSAPYHVISWADKAEHHGVNEAKVASARAIANAMLDWQRAHPDRVKLPD